MFNSYLQKKIVEKRQQEKQRLHKDKIWQSHYNDNVKPILLHSYKERVNNFVARVESNNKQFYEFRQQTQQKAHELLKQIYHKQHFLGDSSIKLKSTNDWNSMLPPSQQIQMRQNRKIFERRYGDGGLASRSVASQSLYSGYQKSYRSRQKTKEIHPKNMRFTSRSRSFSQNKRQASRKSTSRDQSSRKSIKQQSLNRHSTHNSDFLNESIYKIPEDDHMSQAASLISNQQSAKQSIISQEVDKPKINYNHSSTQSKKVYFKQLVDFQQNSKQKQTKKNLNNILVKFGISRIKDVKKMALLETNAESSFQ